jgi:hypothetical protein
MNIYIPSIGYRIHLHGSPHLISIVSVYVRLIAFLDRWPFENRYQSADNQNRGETGFAKCTIQIHLFQQKPT